MGFVPDRRRPRSGLSGKKRRRAMARTYRELAVALAAVELHAVDYFELCLLQGTSVLAFPGFFRCRPACRVSDGGHDLRDLRTDCQSRRPVEDV
jgi:hypothetical protein